jgi:hypothetical protein
MVLQSVEELVNQGCMCSMRALGSDCYQFFLDLDVSSSLWSKILSSKFAQIHPHRCEQKILFKFLGYH